MAKGGAVGGVHRAPFQQLQSQTFPIHETVTWAHCHCSPAPAMIYWLLSAVWPERCGAVHTVGGGGGGGASAVCPSLSEGAILAMRAHVGLVFIKNKSTDKKKSWISIEWSGGDALWKSSTFHPSHLFLIHQKAFAKVQKKYEACFETVWNKHANCYPSPISLFWKHKCIIKTEFAFVLIKSALQTCRTPGEVEVKPWSQRAAAALILLRRFNLQKKTRNEQNCATKVPLVCIHCLFS